MRPNHPSAARNERGIALVAAVLVVLLSSLMVATFMTTSTGERSISSNVQTAKASLYAADAGIRTQQQLLANAAQVKLDSCVTAWNAGGGVGPIITNPGALFPSGAYSVSTSNPPFSATGTIAWADSDLTPNAQVYNYRFTISSTGTVRSTGTRRVQSQGLIRVSAERGSFADYLVFTNTHTTTSGGAVWFTSSVNFDGRVHTNGQFRFGFQPTFQDLVTSVHGSAWFQNNGSPVELAANNNGSVDVPNFYGGFNRGQATVALPTNSFNQQSAALGLSSTVTSAPTNSTINTQLGLGSSGSTPPNGIYVVNSGGAATGGIYVQGTLDQSYMWCDTTARIQYYRLTQGSTTRCIRVNQVTNTTTVFNGATPTGLPLATYTGQPRGILYVNGAVSDLRGPDRVSGNVIPAVAEGTQMLVCATGDIVIQRDITMDNYNAATNVLGLYSSGGSVRVGSGCPDNTYLDAYVMATGTNGAFMVDNHNSGSARGMFHLRGGLVASYYGAFFTFNSGTGTLLTGFGRDYHYDRRGLIPPYYPSISRFNADTPSARTLAWKEI